MLISTTVMFRGLSLAVTGDYYPAYPGKNVYAGPDPEPPEPAQFELQRVWVSASCGDMCVEITDFLDDLYRPVRSINSQNVGTVIRYKSIDDDLVEVILNKLAEEGVLNGA